MVEVVTGFPEMGMWKVNLTTEAPFVPLSGIRTGSGHEEKPKNEATTDERGSYGLKLRSKKLNCGS
jgi:hypothetical protein